MPSIHHSAGSSKSGASQRAAALSREMAQPPSPQVRQCSASLHALSCFCRAPQVRPLSISLALKQNCCLQSTQGLEAPGNQTAEYFMSNFRMGKTLGVGSFGKASPRSEQQRKLGTGC